MLVNVYLVLRRQNCFTWNYEPGYLYSTPDLHQDFSFLLSVEIRCSKLKFKCDSRGPSRWRLPSISVA